MVKCTFTRNGPDAVCTRCGRVVKNYTGDLARLHAVCRVDKSGKPLPPSKPPSIIERAKHYAVASARWSAAGCPSRSDEEVEAILAICMTCKNYNGAGCNLCGCRVNRKRAALLNKARMATERCPVGLW